MEDYIRLTNKTLIGNILMLMATVHPLKSNLILSRVEYFTVSVMNWKVNWYGKVSSEDGKIPITEIYIEREFNQNILIGGTSANNKPKT